MIMITSFFVAIVFGGAIFLHALRYQPFSIDPAIYLLVAALVALGVMVYKILIYPFAVSPLRHLPTPKVRTFLAYVMSTLLCAAMVG